MIDLPNGTPKQITSYEDNVGFVRFSPKGDALVFGKAKGGDENTQFFWMKADGTGIKELTNSPKIRHNFGGWSDDGAKIYYSSNKRNPQFFDVYRMNVADGKEEIVHQQDGSNSFADASKDGGKIIVSRSGTELSLDNNLYLIDVATKKEILLTPHEGSAQFGDVHFINDNEIEFTTNVQSEFMSPAKIALDGKNLTITQKKDWDLDSIEISRTQNFKAHVVNREGFSELDIYNPKKRGKDSVKLPAQGIVGGLNFSNDGKYLAFSFSSAKYNADIWLYEVEKKTLTQITKSERSGIPQESFVEPQLIKFKSFDGREIPAWYYIPANIGGIRIRSKLDKPESASFSLYKSDKPQSNMTATARFPEFVNSEFPQVGIFPANSRKFTKTTRADSSKITSVQVPVIISVHGGPEGQERPGFNPLYQYYLSRGYAVLATNVRGSTGYGKTFTHLDDVEKREDSVKDLAASVEWLKTSGGADPKRIAVMGGSYGGYMTMAAITLYPDLFAAAVNTVGIVNWETFLKNTSGYRRRQREVEYGMLDKNIDFLRSISPMKKVDKIKTPLFVIHGKNDPRVPYTEAEQVVKALKDRNAIVEYKLFDDEGHGISKLKNRLELYPLVADFLDKYMK